MRGYINGKLDLIPRGLAPGKFIQEYQLVLERYSKTKNWNEAEQDLIFILKRLEKANTLPASLNNNIQKFKDLSFSIQQSPVFKSPIFATFKNEALTLLNKYNDLVPKLNSINNWSIEKLDEINVSIKKILNEFLALDSNIKAIIVALGS